MFIQLLKKSIIMLITNTSIVCFMKSKELLRVMYSILPIRKLLIRIASNYIVLLAP